MLSQDSLAVHAGRDGLTELGVHAVPIDLSTTAPLPSVHDGGLAYEHMATGGSHVEGQSTVYQRLWNPTVARFEEGVAVLEGTPESVAFATGMAALSAVLLAVVAAGKKHVVAVRPLYGGSDYLLASGVLGNEVTFTTPEGVRAALRPDTGLVILETPANPTLELVDIARGGCRRRRRAAPGGQHVRQPGAAAALQARRRHGAAQRHEVPGRPRRRHGRRGGRAPEWAVRLRQIRAVTGGILTPWPAYLLHRGLATLPVRVRAQQASAEKVAVALAGHGLVKRVYYPGLAECDPQGLIGTQMSGPGSLMAFELASAEHAERIPAAVGMITHAVSLGGIDTLIQHPAGLTHRPVEASAKPHASLLRISVGLEDPADIVADLVQAIEATR